MLKSEVFSYYKKCATNLEVAYDYIKSQFDVEQSVSELCKFRGYTQGSPQEQLIRDMQICYSVVDNPLYLGEMATELGLVTSTDRFLLDDRFIIPVRDISGALVSLIGYYPDNKKYITVASPFFSKDVLFFNIDHAYRLSHDQYRGVVFLVEGIFDCLSLRAVGLPAIATMGSTVSATKREVLKLFNKVLYIPDNDTVGRRALNRYDKKFGWSVPENAVGIKLNGVVDFNQEGEVDKTKILKMKDIDNFVNWFDISSVRSILLSCVKSKDAIVDLDIGYFRYFS